jgi:hypothetical protein
MSRPLEDCEGCPALAGVRNLGLDDPSAGCPDSHCNSGDRRIRAGRAAAALSQFPQAGPYGRNCSPPTQSRNNHTCRAGRGGFTPDGALIWPPMTTTGALRSPRIGVKTVGRPREADHERR